MTAADGAPPPLRVTRLRSDGRTLVTVEGELDLATVGEFSREVRGALSEGPVTLDLRQLAFMDSSGIRALDELLRDAEAGTSPLTVHPELQSSVRQLLELTGMMSVLPLEED